MDRRTKIFATLFGALVTYGIVDRVVWPHWIAPLLTIDQRVVAQRARLEKLRADEEAVLHAKRKYEALVTRVGSFDIGKVQIDLLDRLGRLIEKNNLESVNVTPGRPREDNKTGLKRMLITVKAVGTLQSAVEFLKEVAELPQLVRVGNAAIYPVSRSRKGTRSARMNLRVPVEVMVLPQQKFISHMMMDEAELAQPESFARHQDRNYSLVWDLKPFSEYVPPRPLQVNAGRDVHERPGRKKVSLTGSATGGDGPYTYLWEPAEGLSDPASPRPKVDMSTTFTRTYTLTVTDGTGKNATDTVTVVVQEPGKRTQQVTRSQAKPVDKRWGDRKYMQLRMTLLSSTDAGRSDELAIYNNRSKRIGYYTIGDEFNGGELVFVHPTGGLVRRNDEYFIYPIGGWIDQDIRVDDTTAEDYPQLKEAAEQMGTAAEEETERTKAAAETPGDALKKTAGATVPAGNGSNGVDRERTQDKSPKPGKANGTARTAREAVGTEEYPPLPDEIMRRLEELHGKKTVKDSNTGRSEDEQDSSEDAPR